MGEACKTRVQFKTAIGQQSNPVQQSNSYHGAGTASSKVITTLAASAIIFMSANMSTPSIRSANGSVAMLTANPLLHPSSTPAIITRTVTEAPVSANQGMWHALDVSEWILWYGVTLGLCTL